MGEPSMGRVGVWNCHEITNSWLQPGAETMGEVDSRLSRARLAIGTLPLQRSQSSIQPPLQCACMQ